jgi:hypothetical protein
MAQGYYLIHFVHEFGYLKFAWIMSAWKNGVGALRKTNCFQLNDGKKEADFWTFLRKSSMNLNKVE